jgi:glucokinase
VTNDPGGLRCACGNTGCLETIAAGPAIASRTVAARAARRNGHDTGASGAPGPSGAVTGQSPNGAQGVFAAAAEGDEVALEVIATAGRAVAWGIHLLALSYDVERIILGGGVSHAGEPFMAPVRRELDRLRATSPLAAEILTPDLVQLLPAGSDAGAWGAVIVAREAQGREVSHA